MKADHDFTARILLCRWLVAALVLCFPLIGQAAKWDRSTDYTWNVGNNTVTAWPTPGAGNLSGWAQGTMTPAATGPTWTSPGKALPFNPSPTANFKAKFSPASMAKALLNPVNAIPLLATPILAELFNQACVRLAGGSMQLADGAQWEECVMGNVTATVYCYGNDAQCPTIVNNVPTGRWSESPTGCKNDFIADNPPGPGVSYTNWQWGLYGETRWRFDIWQNGQQVQAGAKVDCRTASVTQQQPNGSYAPTTEAAVETMVADKLSAWSQADFLYGFDSSSGKPSGGTKEVLNSIINSGNALDAEIVAPTIQTPINEAPVTTTTTNPDGSKKIETEVTTNDYSCLVIQNGAAVECKQAKTTTKTTATTSNPNGTGTVTTTATAVTTQQTKPGDQVDQCAKYPDSLGCSKVAAESGEAIPRVTKTLTYAAESVLGGGSCPADKFMSIGGQQVKVWNWVQACDYIVSYVKPVFLAVAAFIAMIIIMPGGGTMRGVD